MAEIEITPLGIAGAALLGELHAGAFADPGAAGPPWTEAAFADLLSQPGTLALVAAQAGAPLGLLLLRTVLDEAEILTIGALPAARRRGVGRVLMQAAMDAARAAGAARMFLEVAAGNMAARRLYESLEFQEIGRRRQYYRHGDLTDDAVVMARELA